MPAAIFSACLFTALRSVVERLVSWNQLGRRRSALRSQHTNLASESPSGRSRPCLAAGEAGRRVLAAAGGAPDAGGGLPLGSRICLRAGLLRRVVHQAAHVAQLLLPAHLQPQRHPRWLCFPLLLSRRPVRTLATADVRVPRNLPGSLATRDNARATCRPAVDCS